MSEWYYAVDNEQKGPTPEAELKGRFAAAQLSPETLVWKEGMENWAPARQVPVFAGSVSSGSATPPPPPLPGGAASEAAAPVHNPESTTPATVASLFGPPQALEVDPEDAEQNKIYGILAYVFILWLAPLIAAPKSPFARYHANQGLVLFIVWFACIIVLNVLDSVFNLLHVGFLSTLFSLVYLVLFGLMIFGVINAAQGKCVPLPVIGGARLIR